MGPLLQTICETLATRLSFFALALSAGLRRTRGFASHPYGWFAFFRIPPLDAPFYSEVYLTASAKCQ